MASPTLPPISTSLPSSSDVFAYFRCITPQEYNAYGIDEDDVPFGTIPALKHPTFLPSPFGGNAYGLGLFEQHLLTQEEIQFLCALDLSNPSVLGTHAPKINELYRKMGLLTRISREGTLYYLIPYSFIAHSILDIRSRVNLIEAVWGEIQSARELHIGIMTSPEDMFTHEVIARFPHHRFSVLSSLKDFTAKTRSLDACICPHAPYDYLRTILSLHSLRRWETCAEKTFKRLLSHLFALLYRLLTPQGVFILVCPTPLKKTSTSDSSLLSLTITDPDYARLYHLFAQLYLSHSPPNGPSTPLETTITETHLHTFLTLAPSLSGEIQKILGKPLGEIGQRDIQFITPRLKKIFRSFPRGCIETLRLTMERFFTILHWEESLPAEYEASWRKHMVAERLPAALLVTSAQPRKASTSRDDVERFLENSPLTGCALARVASYKNSFGYIRETLGYAVGMLQGVYPFLLERHPHFIRRCRRFLTTCHRKLDEIVEILTPPEGTYGDPIPFLAHVEECSLLGLSDHAVRELALIVTGHSSMSRVVLGKYPQETLVPLIEAARHDPSLVHYITLMTAAEISASLGRFLTPRELEKVYRVQALLQERVPREHLHPYTNVDTKNLISSLHTRILMMTKYATKDSTLGDSRSPQAEHTFSQPDLIELLFHDEQLLLLFARARFHGTGHVLPVLGFSLSAFFLWSALYFALHASNSTELVRRELIIDFNPLLRSVPQEHRIERVSRIRRNMETLLSEGIPSVLQEVATFHPFMQEHKRWFWQKVGIQFILKQPEQVVEIHYLHLEESLKIIRDFLARLHTRRTSTIPPNTMRSADQHFEAAHRFLLAAVALPPTGSSHDPRRLRKIYKTLMTAVWRGIFEKLFSLEEAHEALTAFATYCPHLMEWSIPRPSEEAFNIVVKSFKRLWTLTERERSNLQEMTTFYTLTKREFGPFAEERISLSRLQISELEEMLSHVHANSSLHQAMVIAFLFSPLPPVERESHLRIFLKRVAQATVLPPRRVKSMQRQVENLLHASDILRRVNKGHEPMRSLASVADFTTQHSLDAAFLLAIISEETHARHPSLDAVDLLLELKQCLSTARKQRLSWERYVAHTILEKGRTFAANYGVSISLFQSDIERYRTMVADEETDYIACTGRYVSAWNRLFRLLRLRQVAINDVAAFWSGMAPLHIYQRKTTPRMTPKAFQEVLHHATTICEEVFAYDDRTRLTLLYALDEGGSAMSVESTTLRDLLVETSARNFHQS